MENLKTLRRAKDLTQLAVQMRTGIDQSLLSKYENGERAPTVENLVILADCFDVSLDYLMDRTSQAKPYPRKCP